MDFELNKSNFINLKKEELNYIDSIAKISSNRLLSETEKLEVYRTLNNYNIKLNEILKNLLRTFQRDDTLTKDNLNDVIIDFDLDKDYLSSLNFYSEFHKRNLFEQLWINSETGKFEVTLRNLINYRNYRGINSDLIQNGQKLIDETIYIFSGYYDAAEDCYGPWLGDYDDRFYGIYEDIRSKGYNKKTEVPKKEMAKFESDKVIIHSKRYVNDCEVRKIFDEELLNSENKTLNECVIKTRNRIDELNYIRSPEYKEKILLDKINELYKRIKGEFIKEDIICSGDFLQILKETYKLPNALVVSKEKVIKNKGKNSVIIIAITKEKEFIITIQNRINNKLIAEFPSGYIEDNEDPIDSAKRELKEETGYLSDDLFIVDEAYTSPGIDNSKTYIVIAKECVKEAEITRIGTELIEYGLFSEKELEYLINENIMIGAMNKLAYYNLINNVDNYKRLKKKRNPFL